MEKRISPQRRYDVGLEHIALLTHEDYPVAYLDFEDLCDVLESIDILKARIIEEVLLAKHHEFGVGFVSVKRIER